MNQKGTSLWHEVYAMVRRIPRGRVMNYGQIAMLLKHPLSARAVGWAMHQCPDTAPWHRVVNVNGGLSTAVLESFSLGLQRHLLETEGIRFRKNGLLDMKRYRWDPKQCCTSSKKK